MAAGDEEYTVELQDQRVFGAGIKRKRVQFIPASTDSPVSSPVRQNSSRAGDRYLSIVLRSSTPDHEREVGTVDEDGVANSGTSSSTSTSLCQICHLPLASGSTTEATSSRPHEASIAHQVCLTHSHPPSHLERTRQGLKYLSSYGWDPDSRLGLGVSGHGIRVPIKPKPKNDTVGLGVQASRTDRKQSTGPVKSVEKLDAKKVRTQDIESRKQRESIQELFYGNGDLERHLGPGRWTKDFLQKATTSSRFP